MRFDFLFRRGLICALTLLTSARCGGARFPIQFRTDRDGFVSLNIYRPDGTLAQPLLSAQRFPAGVHKIAWDGDGAAPGEYTWRGLFHEGIGLKLRGWAANGGATPWETADGKDGWGGDAGVPSAVATDAQQVYLGWSLAASGKAILACDLEGRVRWSHRRDAASGCKALAVGDRVLYVLGGPEGVAAEGGAIYKLNTKDGSLVKWPNGELDLKIASLWPADGQTKPDLADAMAVRHGYIYLTFTDSEFLAVLDAKTGAYLQTVVGAPPGQIDVTSTKTDLPDAPGKLVDADFAVISLGGGVLGKVLFAHDPLWVITSELTPVERDVKITALSVIGDGAKYHRHTAFVGLDGPFHQVQARPLLDTEGYTWAAGRPGGRALLGPWQADALRAVRSVALDATGKLWVAEGDAFPKRISVWDSSGQQGKLVREFFGPSSSGAPGGAINPLDPDLIVGQGCEWRIDRHTGRAACLGVITREPMEFARFGVGENGHAYLVVAHAAEGVAGSVSIFERVGDGDYKLRTRLFSANRDGLEVSAGQRGVVTQTMLWADENGDGESQSEERHGVPGGLLLDGSATNQDLTLYARTTDGAAQALQFKVAGWTACGAPRYDLAHPVALPRAGQVSADGRLLLTPAGSEKGDAVTCSDLPSGRVLWSLPSLAPPAAACGSARVGGVLGNIWIVLAGGEWHIVSQDGFDLARLFQSDRKTARWPAVATPGADMTHAIGGRRGSLAQAVDGKLYLQAGESAYWNLEVTGLEKVKALPGGKVVVPSEGRAPARP